MRPHAHILKGGLDSSSSEASRLSATSVDAGPPPMRSDQMASELMRPHPHVLKRDLTPRPSESRRLSATSADVGPTPRPPDHMPSEARRPHPRILKGDLNPRPSEVGLSSANSADVGSPPRPPDQVCAKVHISGEVVGAGQALRDAAAERSNRGTESRTDAEPRWRQRLAVRPHPLKDLAETPTRSHEGVEKAIGAEPRSRPRLAVGPHPLNALAGTPKRSSCGDLLGHSYSNASSPSTCSGPSTSSTPRSTALPSIAWARPSASRKAMDLCYLEKLRVRALAAKEEQRRQSARLKVGLRTLCEEMQCLMAAFADDTKDFDETVRVLREEANRLVEKKKLRDSRSGSRRSYSEVSDGTRTPSSELEQPSFMAGGSSDTGLLTPSDGGSSPIGRAKVVTWQLQSPIQARDHR